MRNQEIKVMTHKHNKKLTDRQRLILNDLTKKPSKRVPKIRIIGDTVYVDELDESFINAEWCHLTDEDKAFIEEVKRKITNGEDLDYE